MNKVLKNYFPSTFTDIAFILVLISLLFSLNGCGGDGPKSGIKEFTLYLGRPNEDYPEDGTILGDWIEGKTKTRIKWEFPVGDLKTKAGLLIASGDYPDMLDFRNENQFLLDAGAFIQLDDLIEEHGPNIKKLYGKRFDMLRKKDGHIYWLPQLAPYGDKVQRTLEGHGLYIQKAVLKEFGYPIPKNVEEAFDLLIKYAEKYPKINGKDTKAFIALAKDWREFPLMNAPSILSGHPNDGACSVDWVNGKWVATQFYATDEAYKIYKLYNMLHLKGLYDTESFVMDYDQYKARLSQGNILAFYDQRWQFTEVTTMFKKREGPDNDRWWVPLPIVMDGYEEEYEGPAEVLASEGVGISIKCKDPVGAIKYLDFLTSEEAVRTREWGFEGTDYSVDKDGYFVRTREQIDKWLDDKWKSMTFGQKYWIEMCGWSHNSMYSDEKNAVDPRNQPSIFFQNLYDTEKEVLNAYGKKTWFEFFKAPDMRRAKYFPAWTIKIPSGSDIQIADEKIKDVRRKYTPRLIMAKDGEYDTVWKEYLEALDKVEHRKEHEQFWQDEIDKRIADAGGY